MVMTPDYLTTKWKNVHELSTHPATLSLTLFLETLMGVQAL